MRTLKVMIRVTGIFSIIICTLIDLQWINWLFMEQKPWKFLGKLINKKVSDLYTILTVHEPSLKVSYLPRNPSDDITGDQLESFLRNEILQESILLPISYERSFQLVQELKTEKNDDDVAVIFSSRKMRDKQKQIVIFGYQPKVIEWKKKFLHIIERNTLHTYKFSPIDQSSVSLFIQYYFHFIPNSLNIPKEYMRLKNDTNHLG